jgi:hypothetical protein
VRRLASVTVWWAVLVCVWTAFVGTTAKVEVLCGLAAAAVATVAAEVLRAQGLLAVRVERLWELPAHAVADFGVVTWALVRALAQRRRVAL